MKYIVKKPDGSEVHFRSRDEFVIAYNTGAIDASWPGKAEGPSEWSRVAHLLGVNPAVAPDAAASAPPAGASLGAGSLSRAPNPDGPAVDQDALARRYRDAYRVAGATVAIGQVLKVLAICLAGLCLIGAAAGVSQSIANQLSPSAGPLLVGLAAAAAVGVPFYALGILVSAAGQVLKATLDTAVHTSPFLDKSQMARIILLR